MKYLIFICLILISPWVFAGEQEEYDQIRSEYRSLMIEDSDFRDSERWHRVDNSLNSFLNNNSTSKFKPQILYLLARFYEQRSKHLKDSNDIVFALQRFNQIIAEHGSSDLVDDAFLGIARIKQKARKLIEAREALSHIVTEYPDSDSMHHAKAQLSQLEQEIELDQNGDIKVVSDQDLHEPLAIGSLEQKKPLVLIDPGHGGEEDGAIGPMGIKEKEITLKISFLVRDLLMQNDKVRVQLTRIIDETIKLSDRTKKANEYKADLFVSIHANASEYRSSRGVETYYLDNTNDKSSLRLAERENFTSSGNSNDSLSFIVSDFIQGIKMDDSITLAHSVQDSIVGKLKEEFPQTKNLGVKRAPFYVLVGAHMPCILTEVSFIDHPEEGKLLTSVKYQETIANGIAEGIISFLKKKARY